MRPRPIGNGNLTPRIPREVAALLSALQMQGGNTDALQELTEREWQALLEFCKIAQLTLPLAQLDGTGFPLWVVERLQRNVDDNAARFERVKSTYKEAADALNRASVKHIVIEGFTQSPHYVKNPRLRAQSDIDLHCPPEMIDRARSALQSIGYEPDHTCHSSRADHIPVMVRRGDWQWRGNAFDPDLPLAIEIHFCLWNEGDSLIPLPDIDRFWDRRIIRSLEGISFPALDSVDHLGHFALHILRNLLMGDWVIHHVRELAAFLHNHAGDDEFWKTWKANHGESLRRLEAIAFVHAISWFGCEVYREVEADIAQISPEVQQWLKRFVGSPLEGMFRQNKDGLWLHSALLESDTERRRVMWRTLVPRKIPGINHPGTKLRNRRTSKLSDLHPRLRYPLYLLSRLTAHARMDLATLLRGLGWWMSKRVSERGSSHFSEYLS